MTPLRRCWLLLLAATAVAQTADPGLAPRVRYASLEGLVDVTIGTPFTALRWAGLSRPVLWPLRTSKGVAVTRAWPLQETAEGSKDHVHQKSLWFAHGDVNGIDFWSEAKGAGRIEVVSVDSHETEPDAVRMQLQCRWLDADGKVVCTDARAIHCVQQGEQRYIDYEVDLCASHGALRLGDTKEGTMALRVADGLTFATKASTGSGLDSEGRQGAEIWGKAARWVAFGGKVGDAVAGVALFDHPSNPRHPTTWHARPYGLLAANPFGLHDFTKAPPGSGELQIAVGTRVAFSYRIVLFDGSIFARDLDRHWQRFAAAPRPLVVVR
jgi:hypothetical protein